MSTPHMFTDSQIKEALRAVRKLGYCWVNYSQVRDCSERLEAFVDSAQAAVDGLVAMVVEECQIGAEEN